MTEYNTSQIISSLCLVGHRRNTTRDLNKVLTKLKSVGLTANKEETHYSIPQLEFMGQLLSDMGIGPCGTKVEAVWKTKIPENAKEVCSFPGLVNFCAKCFPGLATISEPLHRLTRQNVPFHWSKEQDKSFTEIKCRLGDAGMFAYFDQD